MKHIAIFLLLPVVAAAQQKVAGINGFTITGKIAALPNNSEVYFVSPNAKDTLSKAMVKQGTFVLKGKVENMKGGLLCLPAMQKIIFLFYRK